jgi:hypothetical protein
MTFTVGRELIDVYYMYISCLCPHTNGPVRNVSLGLLNLSFL